MTDSYGKNLWGLSDFSKINLWGLDFFAILHRLY